MSEVTKPIALDESINTTEQTPRNIADVLAEELAGIAGAITTSESVEDILTDMATTKDAQVISGTAVFNTVDGNLVKTLKVAITPSQAGSGTPSPSNLRPISGYTEEVISVKDETDTTQETYTTPFNQTVYGGTLDVLTGELTITHGYVDLGTLTWTRIVTAISGKYRYKSNITSAKASYIGNETSISSAYELLENGTTYSATKTGYTISNISELIIYDSQADTLSESDFKNYVSGSQLVYELATPTTIQLTPQKVKSLVGENHIMASTGDVLECKFSMMINGDDLEMLLS